MAERLLTETKSSPAWLGFGQHLHLDRVAAHEYVGWCLPGRGGLIFGGHLAAHAITAVGNATGRALAPRSLHIDFIRAGNHAEHVSYGVEPLRIGRSIEHWRVVARQDAGLIAAASVVLSTPQATPGPSHRRYLRADEIPDDLPISPAVYPGGTQSQIRLGFDMRQGAQRDQAAGAVPFRHVWFRVIEPLPADAFVHAAVFAWASDLEMTSTADLPYRAQIKTRRAASIDHAIILHDRWDLTDWWLYRAESSSYRAGHALIMAEVFPPDHHVTATVVQQAMLRITVH
jgi:acyl-CoA thioesterase II